MNTNPLYTEREMLHQFNDSGAKALICMDVFAKSVQNVKDQTGIKHIIVTSLADMLPGLKRIVINAAAKHIKKMVPAYSLPEAVSFRKALKLGKGKAFQANHMKNPHDTIILQYTGGTTGVAKGAELTNRNLVANMLQSASVLGQKTADGSGMKAMVRLLLLRRYRFIIFTHSLCI